MPITQAEYDAYFTAAVTAYAARQGARAITFGDQSVTFDSWSDIWAWLSMLRGELESTTAGHRTRYAATSKGF